MKTLREILNLNNDEDVEEDLELYAQYVREYAQLVSIMEQIEKNKDYYISVRKRRLIERWLKEYDKQRSYVV